MSTTPIALGRLGSVLGTFAVIVVGLSSGACVKDDIPACPGQCFEYTVEFADEQQCTDGFAQTLTISFTGTDPDGYHGRSCSNSESNALVADAINHLRSGGSLDELGTETAAAYSAMVSTLEAQVYAGCMAAAPDQCIDEEITCNGIVADMHAQLITAQTCILEPGGVEEVALRPGEVCQLNPVVFDSTGGSGDFCTMDGGVDDTAGDGADGTTGAMADPPFGDVEALVSCNSQTECEIDSELLSNISASFGVFEAEGVTLTLVDETSPCGPGARIGGLDDGEDSAELAEILDLRNGDVIRQVESVSIDGLDEAMEAVSRLLESPSTTLVIRRPSDGGCQSLTYELEVL